MQTITTSWFVQGMIKATSDAWLKGWDERNGGNLTLRLDDADIEPFAADFHQKPRYIALSQPMPLLANARQHAVYRHRFREVLPQRSARPAGQPRRSESG